jgi:hypothetical protein
VQDSRQEIICVIHVHLWIKDFHHRGTEEQRKTGEQAARLPS